MLQTVSLYQTIVLENLTALVVSVTSMFATHLNHVAKAGSGKVIRNAVVLKIRPLSMCLIVHT
jgi:hypothetical protein